MKNANKKIVICLPASTVRGQISYNFVKLLEQRVAEDGFQFINAGVAGDQAYNVLMRLDSVIKCQPDFAVILVDTNDVTATLSPALAVISRLTKRLPQPPSIEFYRYNMLRIIHTLKDRTSAKIALVSLPVLGEDPESMSNHLTKDCNALLKDITDEEQVEYLPVYEHQEKYLREVRQGSGRPYESGRMLSIKAFIHHYLLRQSFDEISRRRHFLLSTDGIHMNSRGAVFIADKIEPFLRSHV